MPDSPTLGDVIAANHWEQGSVLPGPLAVQAVALRPSWMQGSVSADDWLVVVSHPCDLVNPRPANEPAIEVLRMTVQPGARPDSGFVLGKNPRRLAVVGLDGSSASGTTVLHGWAHDRWSIPRELLTRGTPDPNRRLPQRVVSTLAIWLAKRYVRAAFPGRFDERWRGDRLQHLKAWTDLIAAHGSVLSGVYLRLNTEAELHDLSLPYVVTMLVLYDRDKAQRIAEWPTRRAAIQTEVERFWSQHTGITCVEVLVQAIDETTVDQITPPWRKFEADWLSFAEDAVEHAQAIPDDAGA